MFMIDIYSRIKMDEWMRLFIISVYFHVVVVVVYHVTIVASWHGG